MGLGKVSEVCQEHKTVLVYGQNGTGKSRLSGTAYEVPNVKALVVECEPGGSTTFARYHPNEMVYVVEKKVRISKQLSDIEKASRDFDLIVIDGFTYLMDLLMEEITGGKKATFVHWQTLFRETKKFIRAIEANTDMLMITVLEEDRFNSDGDIVGYDVMMAGRKFPPKLMSMFSVIGRTTIKTKKKGGKTLIEQYLDTDVGKNFLARDRSASIGKMKDPTVKKIFDLLTPATKDSQED